MTDAEREVRARWKLSEGGYIVRKDGAGYLGIAADGAETALADLAALDAFAEAVYERVWTGRKITPSDQHDTWDYAQGCAKTSRR